MEYGYCPREINGECRCHELVLDYSWSGTCLVPDKLGNGICDGDANINGPCMFDGGDCCRLLIDNSGCSGDSCTCFEDNFIHSSLQSYGCLTNEPILLGDGKCQDDLNVDECLYDFGDCCQLPIDDSECEECICKYLGVKMPTSPDSIPDFLASHTLLTHESRPTKPSQPLNMFVYDSGYFRIATGLRQLGTWFDRMGDKNCHEKLNNMAYHYDFGDCCLPNQSDFCHFGNISN